MWLGSCRHLPPAVSLTPRSRSGFLSLQSADFCFPLWLLAHVFPSQHSASLLSHLLQPPAQELSLTLLFLYPTHW